MNKYTKLRAMPLCKYKIPLDITNIKNETFFESIQSNWKILRRELLLLLANQIKVELQILPPPPCKVLFLMPSIKNIGDAIMILSGRKLLKDSGYSFDVLMDKKYSELFVGDEFIDNCFTNPSEIKGKYDVIILDSFKSTSQNIKLKYFKNAPWIKFYGHLVFGHIDVNWIYHSAHRINTMMQSPVAEKDLLDYCVNRLPNIMLNKTNQLVISIGGEDKYRKTYPFWGEVISGIIDKFPKLKIILVGSNNALNDEKELVNKFGDKIHSEVAKLSLKDTADVINNSQFFLGCDGGLMHIALAYKSIGLALFGFYKVEYLLPHNASLDYLWDPDTVKNITPKQVLSKFTNSIESYVHES